MIKYNCLGTGVVLHFLLYECNATAAAEPLLQAVWAIRCPNWCHHSHETLDERSGRYPIYFLSQQIIPQSWSRSCSILWHDQAMTPSRHPVSLSDFTQAEDKSIVGYVYRLGFPKEPWSWDEIECRKPVGVSRGSHWRIQNNTADGSCLSCDPSVLHRFVSNCLVCRRWRTCFGAVPLELP